MSSRLTSGVRLNAARDLRVQRLDQSGKHQLHLVNASLQPVILWRYKELQVAAEKQKIIQLCGRTQCNVQKLSQFDSASSSATLGNVRGNRIRRPSHLTRKAVTLLFRKRDRRTVNAQRQSVALLPNQKFPKVLHLSPPRSAFPCLTLPPYGSHPVSDDWSTSTCTCLRVKSGALEPAFSAAGEDRRYRASDYATAASRTSPVVSTYYLILITSYYTPVHLNVR